VHKQAVVYFFQACLALTVLGLAAAGCLHRAMGKAAQMPKTA